MKAGKIAILSMSSVLLIVGAIAIPDSLISIKVASYLIGIALMILVFSNLSSGIKLNSTLQLILSILATTFLILTLLIVSAWFVFY